MKQIPAIAIQLIHIQGPLKGEIQEFLEPSISIGRHPSCDVVFPVDITIISRRHATITREGNRFKLVDKSSNGTYLNGKRVKETFLKDGDVLIFAEGGPKVSFLTKLVKGDSTVPHANVPEPVLQPDIPAAAMPQADFAPHFQTKRPETASPAAVPEARVETIRVPLVIQYGPTLRDFKQVPITIGKSPDCDFTMDHSGIAHQHAQIFFSREQYWIKDLTGRQSILVNNQPISSQAPLNANDRLTLLRGGPEFRFLGGGRLAEIVESAPREPSAPAEAEENVAAEKPHSEKSDKKSGSFFKRILNR
ncbi:MAG: FHA domain-containing protein [Deltaproteobacteria bacterium]|nr:FHA domain-containing protein [Deltaproteobacteria bacterium]